LSRSHCSIVVGLGGAPAVWNTCVYTFVTTVFKLALGLWLALLLNRHFRGKAFMRAFILLPFIIPTVLSTFAWKWMFDPTFSVLNWLLFHLGMITGRINWLGDPDLAMTSIIIVNIWRGVPFFAISLLAGLQTISPELSEAAAIDGAKPWQRFWHITWPLLLPVTMVVVLFSAALLALFGVWLIRAAALLGNIVTTQGNDITHLMAAFRELAKIYRTQFWMWMVGIVLIAVAIVLRVGYHIVHPR